MRKLISAPGRSPTSGARHLAANYRGCRSPHRRGEGGAGASGAELPMSNGKGEIRGQKAGGLLIRVRGTYG